MAVPEQARRDIARWCSERRRPDVRVDYSVLDATVTIVERRPPEMPELAPAWSSRKVAQLRFDNPVPEKWVLFHPVDGGWERSDVDAQVAPGPLLEEIGIDRAGVFWP